MERMKLDYLTPLFSQEIIEKILIHADGETLLNCLQVSSMFAAAVHYLGTKTNIWQRVCKDLNIASADVVSKIHPHSEGFAHQKNWKLIFDSWRRLKKSPEESSITVKEAKVAKDYSEICGLLTHGQFTLALVKYNKNFSIFYRVLTVMDENVIAKSEKLWKDTVYVTPLKESADSKSESVEVFCDSCRLVAIPYVLTADVEGFFPRMKRTEKVVSIEHEGGEIMWFRNPRGMFSKGDSTDDMFKLNKDTAIDVSSSFTSVKLIQRESQREIYVYSCVKENISCAKIYSELLLLGTAVGKLHVFYLEDKTDIEKINLKHRFWSYKVCGGAILAVDLAEDKTGLRVSCCTRNSVYHLFVNTE